MNRVTVDTSQFNAMVREIAQSAGVPDETVLIYEVGKILEQTIQNTKAATVSSIRSSSENAEYSMQPDDLYTPVVPRQGVNSSKRGFIAYYLRNRYPNNLWAKISARRKTSLIAKLKARGLARRSWLDIARRLGLSIKFPAYVGTAVARTGKEYKENTSVQIQRQKSKLQITFQNSQPTVNKIGGGYALQAAVSGRVKYFMAGMSKSVFDKVATIAKRYPGMIIR